MDSVNNVNNANNIDWTKCEVCYETMVEPVTLLCQHTFCRHCIDRPEVEKCPLCSLVKLVPGRPTRNIVIEACIRAAIGEEEYNAQVAQLKADEDELAMEQKIERRLRTEMWREVYNNVVAVNEQPHLGINPARQQFDRDNVFARDDGWRPEPMIPINLDMPVESWYKKFITNLKRDALNQPMAAVLFVSVTVGMIASTVKLLRRDK